MHLVDYLYEEQLHVSAAQSSHHQAIFIRIYARFNAEFKPTEIWHDAASRFALCNLVLQENYGEYVDTVVVVTSGVKVKCVRQC
jgi:hypothetical protein